MQGAKCKICQDLILSIYSDKYGVACDVSLDSIFHIHFLDWASDQGCDTNCDYKTYPFTPYNGVETKTCALTITDESPTSGCSITIT